MFYIFFFFNDTATTAIYTYRHTLSLHDALPIGSTPVMISITPLVSSPMSQSTAKPDAKLAPSQGATPDGVHRTLTHRARPFGKQASGSRVRELSVEDRKSTGLNSSH